MYLPDFLNRRSLFQALGGWPDGDRQVRPERITDLLYRGTSAAIALERMMSLREECVSQFESIRGELEARRRRMVFWSPQLVQLWNEVPPFLSAIRLLQNGILRLTARTVDVKADVPKSLHDAVKKMEVYGFPERVEELVREYWRNHGKRVKAYRDIDQHYSSIVRHTFMRSGKEPELLVLLPDNPEQKSPRRFQYDEEIRALEFCDTALRRIDRLYTNIGEAIGVEPKPLDQQVDMSQLGKLQVGVRATLGVIIHDADEMSGVIIGQTKDRKITARQFSV